MDKNNDANNEAVRRLVVAHLEPLIPRPVLEWTTTTPTAAGWYMVYAKGCAVGPKYIYFLDNHEMIDDSFDGIRITEVTHWLGPIMPPVATPE